MEALGWMIVEGPIVISPFSSTSWQMIALEWIVYLSLLQAEWVGLDGEKWVRGLTLEPFFVWCIERERWCVVCCVFLARVLISFQMTRAFYHPYTVTV